MILFNIKNFFDMTCCDCISIVLDYIETPHDILKLIYYNKYFIYSINKRNNAINTTEDEVQLLLYQKFYEKVIHNLSVFVKKFDMEFSCVSELLDESTILSGGSLLRSIYGEIETNTNIPTDFYKESINTYKEKNSRKLKNITEACAKQREINVCTDLDIFKVIDTDIFSSNDVCKKKNITTNNPRVQCEIDYYKNNSGAIIFYLICYDMYNHTDLDDGTIITCSCEHCELVELIDNQEFDVYVVVAKENSYRQYKITDRTFLCHLNITKKIMLDIIENNEHVAEVDVDIPISITNCDIACSHQGYGVAGYLYKNKEKLMNGCANLQETCRVKILEKKYYYSQYIAYESLQSSNKNEYFGSVSVLGRWVDSVYDPMNGHHGKIIVLDADKHIHIDRSRSCLCDTYTRVYNHENKKKIVPLVYTLYNGLVLNLIYVNSKIFSETREFIENDFDINICRQSFNGKKICLYSIGDLVRRQFEYNPDWIENICVDNDLYRYVCFRKRIEKYKIYGFTFRNELDIMEKMKSKKSAGKYL